MKKISRLEQFEKFNEVFSLPMEGAGPSIPQMFYRPLIKSDRIRRYVEDVLLEAPLFFYLRSRTNLGFPLKDALQSQTKMLNHNRAVCCSPSGSR